VVFPQPGGPAIQVTSRFRLRSKTPNKRFRGKTSVRSGRVILAIFGTATGEPLSAFSDYPTQTIRKDWEGTFQTCILRGVYKIFQRKTMGFLLFIMTLENGRGGRSQKGNTTISWGYVRSFKCVTIMPIRIT